MKQNDVFKYTFRGHGNIDLHEKKVFISLRLPFFLQFLRFR